MRHLESLPLLPDMEPLLSRGAKLEVVDSVPAADQFRTAVPVHDLAAAAGGFGESQAPEAIGWAKVHAQHALDSRTFVAKVVGRSMETAIPDGCWALFRLFPGGVAPAPAALDGRRVVVPGEFFELPAAFGGLLPGETLETLVGLDAHLDVRQPAVVASHIAELFVEEFGVVLAVLCHQFLVSLDHARLLAIDPRGLFEPSPRSIQPLVLK